jgi:hypothetical protein
LSIGQLQTSDFEHGYHESMQLHIARLCLDCEEIHDQQTCPVCSSESFAYISRWIPAPERRTRPRSQESGETADIYRQLINPDPPTSGTRRWVRRGVFGLAAVGIAGWAWRRKPQSIAQTTPDRHENI